MAEPVDGRPVAYPEAARALRRATLLDAVAVLVADREWSGTTLADVARTAGVSRQTVYNEFGSREALARAYVLREVDRFLAGVEAAVRAHGDDPAAAVHAGLATFLMAAADSVVVKAVVAGRDGGGLLPLVTTQGAPVVTAARARLVAVLLDMWPAGDPTDVRALADALVRLAISHAAQPDADAATTAAQLARLLAPSARAALSPS